MAHPRDRARRPLTPERIEEIKKIKEKIQLKEDQKDLKTATRWLFITAIILGVSFILNLINNTSTIKTFNSIGLLVYLAIELVPIAIFIALGVWSKTKPYSATLTGLIVFTVIIFLNVLLDSSSIFSGILFKFLIYVFLIQGLRVAIKYEKSIKNQDNIIDDIEF